MSGRETNSNMDSPRNYGSIALDIVLASGALAVLVVSVALAPGNLPSLPLCAFRLLTGLPCAGCGITRAFCAIGHGEFSNAWACNPFGFVFYTATIALLFWPLIKRKWPGLEKRLILSAWFRRVAVLLIAAMLTFGAARLLGALCAWL